MMRLLYRLAVSLACLLALPLVLALCLVSPWWRRRLAEKAALRLPTAPPQAIWIHAASMGEAQLGIALLERIRCALPDKSCFLTTNTRAGLVTAEALDHPATMAPIDQPLVVRRFLDRLRPAALLLVEAEIWPEWLEACQGRGIKTILINGRVTSRSATNFRRFGDLFRRPLSAMNFLFARSKEDAARLEALSVDPERISVSGDVKRSLVTAGDEASVRRKYGYSKEDAVLVAGSTDKGEEELVLDALSALPRELQPRLVIAPRQPARFFEVFRLLTDRPRHCHRASAGTPARTPEVLLLDTIGDLASCYSMAKVAFVGGSFTDRGGQNILEPALAGCPVLYGPNVENFQEAAHLLEEAGGGFRCRDAGELQTVLRRLLEDPEYRRRAGEAARLAARPETDPMEATLAILLPMLEDDDG